LSHCTINYFSIPDPSVFDYSLAMMLGLLEKSLVSPVMGRQGGVFEVNVSVLEEFWPTLGQYT
jgi:hypothetical protein